MPGAFQKHCGVFDHGAGAINFAIDRIVQGNDRIFLYVDYNELIAENIVLLSQNDHKSDYAGNQVCLREGLEVVGYSEDINSSSRRDDLVSEGMCIRNETEYFPYVQWLLHINAKGIRHVSDIVEEGW